MFETSPGKFTKRETFLIRHFLKSSDSLDRPVSLDKLQKALNLADNNYQWILKAYLIANVKSKRRKSLNQVTTTIHGKAYGNSKIILKVVNEKATLKPKKNRQAHAMYADRSGMGQRIIKEIEILKDRKIYDVGLTKKQKKSKKSKGSRSKKDPSTKRTGTSRTGRTGIGRTGRTGIGRTGKGALSRVRRECASILAALKKYKSPLDPIQNLLNLLDSLNTMLKNHASSLDYKVSGDWYSRITTTARRRGNKLILDYMNVHDKTGDITYSHYEFTSPNGGTVREEVWEKKFPEPHNMKKYEMVKLGVFHRSNIELKYDAAELRWIYDDMFGDFSKNLIRALNSMKNKTYQKMLQEEANKLIVKSQELKNYLVKFWNHRFEHPKNEGQGRGDVIRRHIREFATMLNSMLDKFYDESELSDKKLSIDKRKIYNKDDEDFTSIDLELWETWPEKKIKVKK